MACGASYRRHHGAAQRAARGAGGAGGAGARGHLGRKLRRRQAEVCAVAPRRDGEPWGGAGRSAQLTRRHGVWRGRTRNFLDAPAACRLSRRGGGGVGARTLRERVVLRVLGHHEGDVSERLAGEVLVRGQDERPRRRAPVEEEEALPAHAGLRVRLDLPARRVEGEGPKVDVAAGGVNAPVRRVHSFWPGWSTPARSPSPPCPGAQRHRRLPSRSGGGVGRRAGPEFPQGRPDIRGDQLPFNLRRFLRKQRQQCHP